MRLSILLKRLSVSCSSRTTAAGRKAFSCSSSGRELKLHHTWRRAWCNIRCSKASYAHLHALVVRMKLCEWIRMTRNNVCAFNNFFLR